MIFKKAAWLVSWTNTYESVSAILSLKMIEPSENVTPLVLDWSILLIVASSAFILYLAKLALISSAFLPILVITLKLVFWGNLSKIRKAALVQAVANTLPLLPDNPWLNSLVLIDAIVLPIPSLDTSLYPTVGLLVSSVNTSPDWILLLISSLIAM